MTQCEYGLARTGTATLDRCEKEATEEYLDVLDDEEPYQLCEEHYEQFHYGDYMSKR